MTKTIKYSLDTDGIATLVIDVPDHSMNVLTPEFLKELDGLIDQIAADDKIRGAIIASAKDTFVAGADLAMINQIISIAQKGNAKKAYAQAFGLNQLFRKLETCGKPFVAAVGGLTLGGGFELALCCHHRKVADDPTI